MHEDVRTYMHDKPNFKFPINLVYYTFKMQAKFAFTAKNRKLKMFARNCHKQIQILFQYNLLFEWFNKNLNKRLSFVIHS